MNFASDNWAGVADRVSDALAAASAGPAPAYGEDGLTHSVEQRFCDIFEKDVAVFFVATGSAANALALSSVTPAGGAIFAHMDAHICVDECGGPEFFSGGGKLVPIAGENGKLTPDAISEALQRFPEGVVHHGRPAAISISQATEAGTAYSVNDVGAISEVAKSRGIALHMDGARFANALQSVDASAAELTWKAGVDMLSFGGTKNGCWCAEAVILFDPGRAGEFGYLRKRAGHLFSKSRFIAAQFEAYLRDGYWLELAQHANAMAQRLAGGIENGPESRLAWQPQSNEIFAILPNSIVERLQAAGAVFHPWPAEIVTAEQRPGADQTLIRLVTSFRTTTKEVDAFVAELSMTAPLNHAYDEPK